MKTTYKVLDAYSLIAYLEGEKGSDSMIEIFKSARDSGRDLLLSMVNWGEVYYIVLREQGRKQTDDIFRFISTLPIKIIPVDLDITRQAAKYKASKKMSYADCFAASTAKLYKAELVTGDREFGQVEDELKIVWIT